jgi:hypothetical protein
VNINEELLERKVAAPVQKLEIDDRTGSAVDPVPDPLLLRKSGSARKSNPGSLG